MDRIIFLACEISSVLILVGLIGAWLVLITRKKRALGPIAPLHDREWFKDIFRQGLEILKQSRWIPAVLFAGVVVSACESQLFSLIYFQKHPEDVEKIPQYFPKNFEGYLSYLGREIIPKFFDAAGKLDSAMLHVLHSRIFMSFFLIIVMYALLRTGNTDFNNDGKGISKQIRTWLGVLSGLTGLSLFIVSIAIMTIKMGEHPGWIFIPGPVAYVIAWPMAYALLIPSMDAAGRGQGWTFTTGLAKMEHYFLPMFYFALIMAAVGTAAFLLVYVQSFLSTHYYGGSMSWWVWRLKNILMQILTAMAAFIPVIIAVRQTSFTSAFDTCTKLWARHTKNMTVFIIIGAALLLIPEVLGSSIRHGIPYQGWEQRVISFILSLFKVAVGALIVSSMVVFCRKVMEEEEPPQPQPEGIEPA
jgi:hypothetical protein